MNEHDIPDKYQAIIDHSDYLVTKVRRLEGEIVLLRRRLDEAYDMVHRARDSSIIRGSGRRRFRPGVF